MRNSVKTTKITKQLILSFLKTSRGRALKELLENFDTQDLPLDRYIYVAKEKISGRYKVGISKCPERRIKELNIGNPEELLLLHVYKATEPGYLSETLAHKTLAPYHIRGEWFNEKTKITLLPIYKKG